MTFAAEVPRPGSKAGRPATTTARTTRGAEGQNERPMVSRFPCRDLPCCHCNGVRQASSVMHGARGGPSGMGTYSRYPYFRSLLFEGAPAGEHTEPSLCLARTLLRRTHRRQGGVNASSTYDIAHSVGHFCDTFTVANKGVPRKPHIRAHAVPRPLATAAQTWETQHRSHDGLSGSNSARTCTPRRPMRFRCGPEGVFLCSDPVMAA